MSKQSVLWLGFCFKIPCMCKMITLQTLEKFLRMIVGYKWGDTTTCPLNLPKSKTACIQPHFLCQLRCNTP